MSTPLSLCWSATVRALAQPLALLSQRLSCTLWRQSIPKKCLTKTRGTDYGSGEDKHNMAHVESLGSNQAVIGVGGR
jgi:hypothetical protein